MATCCSSPRADPSPIASTAPTSPKRRPPGWWTSGRRSCTRCRSQRGQDLDESLLEAPEAAYEESDEDGDFDPDEDPLLDKAIEIVVQTQTASVSLLQRRLRVGYTRAGRLVDMLERRGIISGYEGSKPRRVLVSESEPHTV